MALSPYISTHLSADRCLRRPHHPRWRQLRAHVESSSSIIALHGPCDRVRDTIATAVGSVRRVNSLCRQRMRGATDRPRARFDRETRRRSHRRWWRCSTGPVTRSWRGRWKRLSVSGGRGPEDCRAPATDGGERRMACAKQRRVPPTAMRVLVRTAFALPPMLVRDHTEPVAGRRPARRSSIPRPHARDRRNDCAFTGGPQAREARTAVTTCRTYSAARSQCHRLHTRRVCSKAV